MIDEEAHGVPRIHDAEDLEVARDLDGAEDADREEPREHDPPEQAADLRRAFVLEIEEGADDRERQRNDEALERRRRNLEPFDRAQDRDRRSDHPVAIEERAAEQPE